MKELPPMTVKKASAKKVTARKTVAKKASTARSIPRVYAVRKVHIAPPSSATEIRETLRISSADIRAALDALTD
jgi:hypothetical protein